MRIGLALFLAVAAPVSARAATVDINVRGADGKPLAGAVIMVDTPKTATPIHFAWGTEMAQRNIAFDPHVLIVPTGSTVTFPNKDKVRHHVYSFSKVKAFNLKLYGKDEVPSVLFDKPGIVALGCNIHDSMSGFIVVVDTPFAMQTDANGHVSIPGVPAGAATVRLWHPSIRAPGNMLSQAVTVAPTGFSTTYAVHGK
ncbi:MAG: methylamine utilization protein [Sphingomonas bacterium]|uniref:methylamine utilization protein n=1 Tax=Sphingomonas bacterium TaxID=1895847 RepID=UPI00262C1D4F|nr:methylamine utilization protein [Sphingomonas bacterium]MDB5703353.1 methylamine utilization protein [Sphingomonas bacterium]